MKTINYVLLLIGMIGFTTCSPKTVDIEPVEKAPVKIWDRTFGGNDISQTSSIIPTSDGNFIISGTSNSGISGDKTEANKGDGDFWVIKINSSGKKIWDKTFGGNTSDFARSIISTNDGGFLIAGTSISGKSGDKTEINKGGNDFWIIKINSNGEKVWDKTYGGNKDDDVFTAINTLDGGFIISGKSDSDISNDKNESNRGKTDIWIIKINSMGQKVWDKTLGGDNYDGSTCITSTLDGGFVLTGYSLSGISGDKTESNKGSNDYWVIKINSDGKKVWDRTFGGNNYDVSSTIISNNDGSLIICGLSNSDISQDKTEKNRGGYDYWVVKIDSEGKKIWDKTFGGSNSDEGQSILSTTDGGYIIYGSSSSNVSDEKSQNSNGDFDYWIIKINKSGLKIWDKTLGGNKRDFISSIIQVFDGSFIVAGFSYSEISGDKTEKNKGQIDYWLVKLGFQ
jgi:hypothetical protein